MSRNVSSDRHLILLGFFVAFFSSGLGIGGGAILVSMFSSVFNFDFKCATSTSLAMIMPITFVGVLAHLWFQAGTLSFWYYFFIPMCILGSLIGGQFAHKRDLSRLKYVFALFLLVVSFKMVHVFDLPSITCSYLDKFIGVYELPVMMIFGFASGMMSILLGVGCGLVMVPFFLIVLGLNMHEAIRLSLTAMFFMSATATLYNKKFNELNYQVIKCMIVPVIIGTILGAVVSNNLPATALKTIFGVFLFSIACKILTGACALRRFLNVQ